MSNAMHSSPFSFGIRKYSIFCRAQQYPKEKNSQKTSKEWGGGPGRASTRCLPGEDGGRAFQETRKFLMCMLNYTYARARRRSRRFKRSGANKTTEVEKTVELW
jgi:hypothetical protein